MSFFYMANTYVIDEAIVNKTVKYIQLVSELILNH